MSDTLSIALATAGAWAVCRFVRTERMRWLLLAAALVAAAIETRWVFGLVAIPIGVVGLIGLRRVWEHDRRGAIGGGIGAVVFGALVFAPVGLPMAQAFLDGAPVPFAADFGAYHWDALNAFRTTFDTSDGRLVHPLPSGAFYLGQVVAPYWFGPLGLLAVWGGAWVIRRAGARSGHPPRRLAADRDRFPGRVALPEHPVLPVGDAAGGHPHRDRPVAGDSGHRAPDPARAPRGAAVIGGALVVAWVAGAVVVAGRFTDAFIVRQVADLSAIRSLEAQVPPGARLVSMGPTGVFVRDGVPDVVELFDLDPSAATDLLADGRPATSSSTRAPSTVNGRDGPRARTVEAIRASRGLTRIDEAGAWTLYRIGSP